MQRERDEILVSAVRELLLGLRPHEFVRVELGSVSGEAMHRQAAVTLKERLHVTTPVNCAAVPQEDARPPQVAEKLSEERDDLGAGDVVPVQVEVQPESPPARGHGERRDDGHLVAPVAVPQDRRLPDRCPGPTHGGDEQEAALIEEDEMRAPASGVFLSGAIRPVSTAQWPPRHAGGRDVPAFASSTRDSSVGVATPRPRCSAPRTLFG